MRWIFVVLLITQITTAQKVTPFMNKPFEGDYITGAVFDHNYPRWEKDSGGTLLTWWGEEITVGYDGHEGYDWTLPIGTPIYAVAKGVVKFAGTTEPQICPSKKIMVDGGQLVRLQHDVEGQVFYTNYAYLDSFVVSDGDEVHARQLIGYSGQTGTCVAAHLHFDVDYVLEGGKTVDIDPYGWKSIIADPWRRHPEGMESFNMWRPGEAPKLYREHTFEDANRNLEELPFQLLKLRFIGENDRKNPNNEFVEFGLSKHVSEAFLLEDYQLVTHQGKTFTFPPNAYLEPGQTVRVYTGNGQNNSDEFFWQEEHGMWVRRSLLS